MTEIERLVEMMRRVHDGDAWHGPSVMAAIEGVDAREARATPVVGAHSIWQLALHVDAWRREVCARVEGKTPSLPDPADWPAVPADDTQWAAMPSALDASHRALVAVLRALPSTALEAPVGDRREAGLGTGVSLGVMLHGIVHHDAYHAGQIVLLKRATRSNLMQPDET